MLLYIGIVTENFKVAGKSGHCQDFFFLDPDILKNIVPLAFRQRAKTFHSYV